MTPSSLIDAISRPDNFLLQILEDIRGGNPEAARRPARTGIPGFDFGAQVSARGLVPVLEEDLYNPVADFVSGTGSRLLFGPQRPEEDGGEAQVASQQFPANPSPQPQGREIDIQEILAAAGVTPGDTQRGENQKTPFFKVGRNDKIINTQRGSFSRASGPGFVTPREEEEEKLLRAAQAMQAQRNQEIMKELVGSDNPDLALRAIMDYRLMNDSGPGLEQMIEMLKRFARREIGEDYQDENSGALLARLLERASQRR